MVGYRCYILDAEDHIVQAHDLDCDTDAQAAVTAASLLRNDPYHHSAEIWKATRRVTRLEPDALRRLKLGRKLNVLPRPPEAPALT